MRDSLRAAVCACALITPVYACADGTTNLRPAGYAHRVEKMENAADDSDGAIRLVAQTEGWQGPVLIAETVTPVRVWIINRSGQRVRIRYSDFVLVAADGQRFAALPPHAIQGEARVARTVVDSPRFTYSGYAIAPHLVDVYPTLQAWDGPFARDLDYYDNGWYAWNRDVALPTQDMLERALPEGVLEPYGTVEGYLYFEDVPRSKSSVELQAELAAVQSGVELAMLRIPFAVVD